MSILKRMYYIRDTGKTDNESYQKYLKRTRPLTASESYEKDKMKNEKKNEKKFSKHDMLVFAETCMINLLQKPAENENTFSTISSYDLWRIKQVLSEYTTEDGKK